MEQRIRFCKTPNAERMAYAVSGDGPPLVIAPGWISNLQLSWNTEDSRLFWERLSRDHAVVRYDKPGTGLSDRDTRNLGPEARVQDLEALVDYLNLDVFTLFGWSEGGPLAISYTARHPNRIDRLGLYGTFVKWFHPPEVLAPFLQVIRAQWGAGSAALTAIFVPSNEAEAAAYFTELQRASASPTTAADMLETNQDIDVTEEARSIACPALILHREGDTVIPVDEGRKTAALISNSEFVLLEGSDHIPWWGDSDGVLRQIERFLDTPATEPKTAPSLGAFRAILFTDLVGHTTMMRRLGDEKGRAVLREHEATTREVLKEHGGSEVKTMGDGFMASFPSVTKGVECALALQQAFAERNASAGEPLSIRVGLNAGEPIEEDGDLFGETVILAARIASMAEGGEILASVAVRELCAGKGFLFSDLGEHAMRGFEDPVRVFEIRRPG